MNPSANAGAMREQLLNPFPWYTTMREQAPVHASAAHGAVSVFRYEDVQRVLSDYATFSSQFGPRDADPDRPIGASLISTDPPRHRQLRNLVTQAFTPRAVAQLAPRITEIVRELLDDVAAQGHMDIIEDFAYPLPVIVIAEMLGIPPADRARFKRWSDAVVTGAREAEHGDLTHTRSDPHGEMTAFFRQMIAERRREPRDDLISSLLDAEIDGEHLSELELVGFCTLLLIAGNETTTNLIGNAILCFDEHPEVIERLRGEPALLPTTIEEVLRYRSPVQSMFRVTKEETELHGQVIHARQPVVAWIGSANRDGAQFPNADQFIADRTPNRHLAFGQGIHFCLGAPLARLEARIALGAMVERLRDMRRVPGIPLEPLRSSIVFGVRSLPVTFAPA